MKKLAFLLLLVPSVAFAGSTIFQWPNIATNRPLDALSCAATPLMRMDQDHYCAFTSAWTTGNYAAECRFVMAFTGVKTVWHMEGNYDSNQNFTGTIWQTLPKCTGFVCGYIGSVYWSGRSPMAPALYDYVWNDNNQAECAVDHFLNRSGVWGNFYGSY